MGTVSGQLTTFNTPQYVGPLFAVTPTDTPFTTMIGGLTGGRITRSKQFTWQTIDLPAASQPAVLEGADATFSGRSAGEVVQATQIFHEGIEMTYTKRAAVGNLDGEAIIGDQPVQDPWAQQVMLKLEKMKRDIEYTFLNGTYALPADNLSARKMRGLIPAIVTNSVNGATGTLADNVDLLLKTMYDNGAPFRNPVLLAGSGLIQPISSAYGVAPESRSVGGVNIRQLETAFGGLIGIQLVRFMPAGTLVVADLDFIAPVFLEIPDKGFLFEEPLAKNGAYDRSQIYGEVGLMYGPEIFHGKIHSIP